jgi:hypothetical protein
VERSEIDNRRPEANYEVRTAESLRGAGWSRTETGAGVKGPHTWTNPDRETKLTGDWQADRDITHAGIEGFTTLMNSEVRTHICLLSPQQASGPWQTLSTYFDILNAVQSFGTASRIMPNNAAQLSDVSAANHTQWPGWTGLSLPSIQGLKSFQISPFSPVNRIGDAVQDISNSDIAGAASNALGLITSTPVLLLSGSFSAAKVAVNLRETTRSSRRSFGGMKLPRSRPKRASWASHSESLTSVLRPGTFLTWKALTTRAGRPAASRWENTLFQ